MKIVHQFNIILIERCYSDGHSYRARPRECESKAELICEKHDDKGVCYWVSTVKFANNTYPFTNFGYRSGPDGLCVRYISLKTNLGKVELYTDWTWQPFTSEQVREVAESILQKLNL